MRYLSIFLALALSVAATASELSGEAHDFTLKSTTGENIRLSELKGKVVMLNFWASWCGPCRQEMPVLDELHDRYKKAGFLVLGVNVDKKSSKADKMLREIPVTFPVVYDPTSKVSKTYGVNAMPSTFMIDRDGKLRYLHKGYKSGYEDDYRKQIRELIRE